MPNELDIEQDDVLATCESWLAELEEREVASLWREVDSPDLSIFGGFELFDMKKEPWAGQNLGTSEV